MRPNVPSIDQLLNDNKVEPSRLRQTPPPSLLSGLWMYRRLLIALKAMNLPDHDDRSRVTRTLVGDLDLYCTATDLLGTNVKIALTDENVEERRFRNFYHFKRRMKVRGEDDSDFTADMDPFLAFASRCTSSFPFAFEPMELRDILKVLEDRN